MKKRDIWFSIAIIAVVLLLFLSSQGKGHINIDAGGAVTTLRLGSSLLGKTTIGSEGHQCKVNTRLHRPELLRISMQLDGEPYQNVIMQNNKRIPVPKVKIIDEADSVLASGKFEYG